MMTYGQRQILTYLAKHATAGAQDTAWIAEACGHWYDTPWASTRLKTLKKHGLVDNRAKGSWIITDAGLRDVEV